MWLIPIALFIAVQATLGVKYDKEHSGDSAPKTHQWGTGVER